MDVKDKDIFGGTTDHLAIEVAGFCVADATVDDGFYRCEDVVRLVRQPGRRTTLTSEDALGIASAIETVVHHQRARLGVARADPALVAFVGRRDPEHGTVSVEMVRDGVRSPLPYHLSVASHSPGGFGWGDDGPGACQLALAMCVELLGKSVALKQYGEVRARLIARLRDDSWTLPGTEIVDLLKRLAAEAQRSKVVAIRPRTSRV